MDIHKIIELQNDNTSLRAELIAQKLAASKALKERTDQCAKIASDFSVCGPDGIEDNTAGWMIADKIRELNKEREFHIRCPSCDRGLWLSDDRTECRFCHDKAEGYQRQGESVRDRFISDHDKLAEMQRDNFQLRADLNLVAGIATNLMTALGMSWQDQCAALCNFSEGHEVNEKRWKAAYFDACERITIMRNDIKILKEEVEFQIRELNKEKP